MSLIIPALLTTNREELKKMLELCEKFEPLPSVVHVDLMDGEFVRSKSVSLHDLKELHCDLPAEAHLMTKNPLEWLPGLRAFGFQMIIFHAEVEGIREEVASEIHHQGFKVGLAVNPNTPLTAFQSLIRKLDLVLFLSVYPGFYGARFVPQVLGKIRLFKSFYPDFPIGIDGGINPKNLESIISLGVEHICVGSAIMKTEDPKKAFQNLLALKHQTRERR